MARINRTHTLTLRSAEMGVPVERLVAEAIANEGTIYKAAQFLGVHPNAIRYHMRVGEITAERVITTTVSIAGEEIATATEIKELE